MSTTSSGLPAALPFVSLLVSLYALEFCALIMAMAVYKIGDKPFLDFLPSHAGFVLLVALIGLVISTIVFAYLFRNAFRSEPKRVLLTLVLNFGSVVLVFCVAEIVTRLFTVRTIAGPMFANTILLPRSWESVAAHNRAVLAKASAHGSYLVYDKELGWTIGSNEHSKDYNRQYVRQILSMRQSRFPKKIVDYEEEFERVKSDSEEDIYLSSVEGIRSPRVGMAFSAASALHRIAIVGDSFTFGLEVRYEETWGHQLEVALGHDYQVLNFGVDGYGVDQAYLRYERDVLPWKPDIVILGLINDDVRRTMGVYGFLTFPGAEIPFPKPRFVMKGQKLSLLNLPLPTPESIFTKQSITELPFVEYDGSFQRTEWESRFYHYSYSIRFLLSKYPRWPLPQPTVTDGALKSVNGEILRSFVRLARERGSTLMVVYFPARSDFVGPQVGWTVAREVFQTYGIPYLDMTTCVSKVRPPQRFVTLHYSPVTNAAIARCLRDAILETSGS